MADGEYQLVLASDGTGGDSAFGVDATGWTEGFTVTQDEQDTRLHVGAVGDLVEATNSALDALAELSNYDPDIDEAAPLQGDPWVARIATRLRDAVSRSIAGLEGSDALASDLGISLTRDGRLEFDEARVREAFEDDFEEAAAGFAESGSTTEERARFSTATGATEPGTYDVDVTQVATRQEVHPQGAAHRPAAPGGRRPCPATGKVT